MKSENAFALIALILWIGGGALLCEGVISVESKFFEGIRQINVESLVLVGIGVMAIIASAMLWTGRRLAGGLINIVSGIITVFYGKDAEGLMILVSRVLGIVAPKIKD